MQLLKPMRRLLRPLVWLLIRSGVTFPVFAELVRSLYVEVALTDMLSGARARTDSRVSLLTGVHRKEIRRLRSEVHGPDDIPEIVTVSSQAIALWLGSPRHLDADGEPLPLPRTGQIPSFDALVEAVTTDVRPRAVLDDWLEQGIVTLDAQDRVHLNTAAFVPKPGQDEQIFYFARNLHDHISAAVANITAAAEAPFFERSVHYDGLTAATAAELEAAARVAGQQLLVDINRRALAVLDANDEAVKERAKDQPVRRINLGVYVYVEDESEREKV